MNSKKTILVVEDEEAILQALQRILELSGSYEVIAVGDGEKALEALRSTVPDLIISDISMPNLNGLDFCRRVRENPITESTPFVFLTAKKEKMVEGISAGGDDFLLKPFSVDEVLVKIEAIFRRVEKSKIQALQHKGSLEDVPLEKVLELCLKDNITGELILQQDNRVGRVRLNSGDILGVELEDSRDDQALDILRQWTRGTFVIRPSAMTLSRELHTRQNEVDLGKAIELMPNVWWTGVVYGENNGLKNSYLSIYKTNKKPIHLLIDPGSPIHLNTINRKIGQVIGDANRINLYLISSSTPDVALNSMFIRKMNPRALCITGAECWPMLQHYEIPEESVKKVPLSAPYKLKLVSGNAIVLIPASFSPEPGAFMMYDQERRVLYSGNLFSSYPVDNQEKHFLYALETDWNGMLRYHLDHFPGAVVIHRLLEAIGKLDPAPKLIAPRYGRLIREEMIPYFTSRLELLDWGYASVKHHDGPEEKQVIRAANQVLEQIQGDMALRDALDKLRRNSYLATHVVFENDTIRQILCDSAVFYPLFIKTLTGDISEAAANNIRTVALKTAYNLGIHLPDLDNDENE
ncbi:MAG: response regulator [Calditrichaeota bacterium]|nr:MAG: response regulator [Calditrichota bacterium]